MSNRNKAIIARIVEELFNRGKFEVVDELYAEDFVDHSIEHLRLFGVEGHREGTKQLARAAREGLSDLSARLDELICEGDRVAARVSASGIHTGSFMRVPATGRRIDLVDFHFFTILDGKVREHWNQYNSLEIMRQLGVIPSPARGEATP